MTNEKGPRHGGLPENVYRRLEGEQMLGDSRPGWWVDWNPDFIERVWMKRYEKTAAKWRHACRPGKGSPDSEEAVEFMALLHAWAVQCAIPEDCRYFAWADPVAYLTWVSMGLDGHEFAYEEDLSAAVLGDVPEDYESLVGAGM